MKQPAKNRLEWTVFGVSLAMVAALACWLLYAHLTSARTPPSLRLDLGEATRTESGFAVPITVTNVGDTTAADVRIEVVSTAGDAAERSEADIDLVPYRSSRRAWVTFTDDPRRGTLRARVLGYKEP